MEMVEAPNICAGPFGAVYDFYIERGWLMRLIGHVVWGLDLSRIYTSLEVLSEVEDGATIIDVPCGGGLAFRALRPEQDVRYLAGDLSPKMLARAKRRAGKRMLDQPEFAVADMRSLPFADGEADLFLSYSGLHMISDPESAVAEIGRCLKPGGRMVGCTFLAGGGRRQRLLFGMDARRGLSLPPTAADLRRWLRDAGIEDLVIEPERGFGVFRGRKATG
jgi:ubiquinone/menaquinone biosynthesis C-methylase UbiE